MSRQRAPNVSDEDVVQEELNPFSFKEFLRQKETQQEDEEQQQEKGHSGRSSREGVNRCSTHWTEADEEKLRRPQDAVRGDEEHGILKPFDISPRPGGGAEGTAAREGGAAEGGESHEEANDPVASCCRSSLMQQLQEENEALRRSIEELQRSAAASENKAAQLQEELLQTRRREEKEAQDLENMVQSVEHNLRLMTKRAVKAEGCVSKLKLELQQLQADLVCVRSENNSLKAAESKVVMTMRQNARVASEYLNKTASHAHSSIQKLLGEAESLRLVSELLCSIDKISTVDTES